MDVALENQRLERLSIGELRGRYVALFGERTDSRNRQYLIRRMLWRMQAVEAGGLSDRARRRAGELADLADLRQSAPVLRTASLESPAALASEAAPVERPAMECRMESRGATPPPPGSVLIRRYKGKDIQVLVRADGFEWEGELYASLTAVAEAVTGSHWSGNLFFGISGARKVRAKGKT